MPLPIQQVQSNHVARCAIVATGNLHALVIQALNAQAARRGDRISSGIIGVRIVTTIADFTVSNPDNTGAITVATTMVPYDIPATNGMADTLLGGGAALGVEVYCTEAP